MIVDGSYTAWVRPTRRVHLALSVGMTVTGLILAVAGMTSGGGSARTSPMRTSPMMGRSADSVMSGDPGLPAGTALPAPLVPPMRSARRSAPPAPAAPGGKPRPEPGTHGRRAVPGPVPKPITAPTSKPPKPPAAPAAPPASRHAAHPSDVSRVPAVSPARSARPSPLPTSAP